jgi:hypothetical protein
LAVEYLNMSTVIELTVADNEHEDITIVWHAHQSYSSLGTLGIWARRSRHGVAVRSVPGGNKTNRTIPHMKVSSSASCLSFPEAH